ncbi:MAG: flagellar biosynthesis protein FlhF [Gammaproteobacteria bacterium]|nr:MAG: flagellar biosynthesis protein FlhF [Gammaproteobacteria bacterium]
MKIKRTFAKNMKEALRKVREEHGDDAVILSNKKTENGYEVISAIEYDEDLINTAADSKEQTNIDSKSKFWRAEKASMSRQQNSKIRKQISSFEDEISEDTVSLSSLGRTAGARAEGGSGKTAVTDAITKPQAEAEAQSLFAESQQNNRKQNRGFTKIEWSQDPVLEEMRSEIRSLRSLFEDQLSVLEWGGMSRRNPNRASILKRFHAMGLGRDISRKLVDVIANEESLEAAWRRSVAYLSNGVEVTNDDILEQGGVVAVVGATGVGKTTTVAKLAARYSLRHGKGQVALVTTDCYRIGAHEQLRNFGKILGVPVYVASDKDELRSIIESLADKPLVLIDTAGMSQRDVRLAEQLSTLSIGREYIKTYLAVSANTQLPTLNETVKQFSAIDLSGCIVTKTDESASLGAILTILIRYGLPLAYLGVGQRVPEDLQLARGDQLVEKAVELAQEIEEECDEEAFAVAFAGIGKKSARAEINY